MKKDLDFLTGRIPFAGLTSIIKLTRSWEARSVLVRYQSPRLQRQTSNCDFRLSAGFVTKDWVTPTGKRMIKRLKRSSQSYFWKPQLQPSARPSERKRLMREEAPVSLKMKNPRPRTLKRSKTSVQRTMLWWVLIRNSTIASVNVSFLSPTTI